VFAEGLEEIHIGDIVFARDGFDGVGEGGAAILGILLGIHGYGVVVAERCHAIKLERFRWVISTPLGCPVEPEV